MQPAVLTRQIGAAFEITLNRPERGNALGDAIIAGLDDALDELAGTSCAAVVLRGAGKGFCAGLDLADLEQETDDSLFARLIRIELLLQRFARLPQRSTVLAHGFAYGAGADLVLTCRQRIAAPVTKMAFPGVRFGIALGTGRLAGLVGPDLAQALLMRSTPVSAEEALACGLLTESRDMAEWEASLAALAAQDSALDARMAAIIAARLDPGRDDADLAALVRSAAPRGLRARIMAHRDRTRSITRPPAV